MRFPASEEDLSKAGYRFLRREQCRGKRCSTTIFWYETPQKRRIPLSRVENPLSVFPGLLLEPHFANCVDAVDFRRART